MTTTEMHAAAAEALKAWLALPAEQRSEERPWILGFNAGWEERESEILALRAQITEALRKYGNHTAHCNLLFGPKVCDCGFSAALAKTDTAELPVAFEQPPA